MTDRKSELDLRLRENAGRPKQKELTGALRTILDLAPEEAFAIVLGHSDEIRRRLDEVLLDGETGRLTIPSSVWQRPLDDATEISLLPPSYGHVLLKTSDVDEVGFFVVPAVSVGARWRLLLEQDPDGFSVTDLSLSSGVTVTQICEWPDFVDRIEIRAWGEECIAWLTQQNIVSVRPEIDIASR